jgi:1,4-alpha-glucan branching enzyme
MRATGDGWFETETISERRRQEFEEWLEFQDPANQERTPDPNVRSTFALSALDWTGLQHSAHAKCLVFIQELLRLRAQKIVPRLHRMRGHAGDARMLSDRAFRVTWRLADGALLTAIANFDDKAIAAVGAARGVHAPVLYQSSPGLSDRIAQGELPGGAVLFCLREREQ